MQTEKIAIIDLGTNTFHLLIAEVDERDNFVVRGRFKEAVKLGEGGINAAVIVPDAFERGIEALRTFRKLMDGAGVVKVFAFATSAIRSASNGKDFIDAAKYSCDIDVRPINGNMEASYIHDGVVNSVHLPSGQNVLLVDIGGGSVEFSVSHARQPLLLRSLKIGAARLLETINPSDPITRDELNKLYEILDQELSSLLAELREFDLTTMVGSSGTFESLATLIAFERGDRLSAENLNGYLFDKGHFDSIFAKIIASTREERLAMEGMDPLRVDMITLGAATVDYLLKKLPVTEIMVSSNALKEGILFQYIREKKQRIEKFIGAVDTSLRAKTVQNLGVKYHYDQQHSIKVSEIATEIFDQLYELHRLGSAERELLQYGAVLHDIGHFIHPSGHHKHGQYIIMNSNLAGFSTNELVLLANLVRYHRKSIPGREHYHFSILPDYEKRVVLVLAGIIRIADNLDRGHRGLVLQINTVVQPDKIILTIHAEDDVSIEIGHADSMKELLESALERSIEILQE